MTVTVVTDARSFRKTKNSNSQRNIKLLEFVYSLNKHHHMTAVTLLLLRMSG